MRRALGALSLMLATACGSSTGGSTGTVDAGGATGGMAGATGSGGAATGGGPGSGGSGGSGGGASGAGGRGGTAGGSGSGGGGSGGGPGTGGGGGAGGGAGAGGGGTGGVAGAGGDGGSVLYGFCDVPTGLIRVAVTKADTTRDVCSTVTLVFQGGGNPAFAVSTPTDWAVESARVFDGAAACASFPSPGPGNADATSATGTLRFDFGDSGVFPVSATFDMTLGFATGAPFVPTSERLVADAVPLAGSCSL